MTRFFLIFGLLLAIANIVVGAIDGAVLNLAVGSVDAVAVYVLWIHLVTRAR